MNFEKALFELKCGQKIRRKPWALDMYWVIRFNPDRTPFLYTGLVGFETKDILLSDWEIYEETLPQVT